MNLRTTTCLTIAIVAGTALMFLFLAGLALFGGDFGEGETPKSETTPGVAQVTSGELVTSSTGFDRNRVIEDADFTNTSTMTAEQIQILLDSRHSLLSDYREGERSAAQIIYDGTQKYGVNPQVILVMLHKEQSLLSDSKADPERRLRKAMGAACFEDGTCDPRLFGFSRQIDGGLAILRRWFDRAETGKKGAFKIGETVTIDGQEVTFANKATASLYKYTPHIVPDKTNFYNFFRDFFLRIRSSP